jgi:hypothetical protein
MNTNQPSKIDLTVFFLSVSSNAFRHLEEGQIDLEVARQNIDLLELMEKKTEGNRTPDEDRLLSELLFQLRMKFVEVSNK